MSPLSKIPAFGFETKKVNANDVHERIEDRYEKDFDVLDSDDPMVGDTAIIFTYKNPHIWFVFRKATNFYKFLGYIPLSGIFYGLVHLRATLKLKDDEVQNKINHVVRAVFETLSLGFLLIIPDLTITAYRQITRK